MYSLLHPGKKECIHHVLLDVSKLHTATVPPLYFPIEVGLKYILTGGVVRLTNDGRLDVQVELRQKSPDMSHAAYLRP